MFDFLSNIYNKAKSAVSSASNYISKAVTPSSQSASVMNFRVGEGLDPAQNVVANSIVKNTQLPQQSVAPNMSTVLGPAYGANNGTIQYNTSKGVAAVPASQMPNPLSTPYYPANPQLFSPSLTVKNQTGQSYVGQTYTPTPTATVIRQAQAPTVGSSYNSDWFTPSGVPLDKKNGIPIHGDIGAGGSSSVNIGAQGPSSITGGNGSAGTGGFSVGGNPLGSYNAASLGLGENTQEAPFKKIKYNPTTGKLEGLDIPGANIPIFDGVNNSIASRLFPNKLEKPLQAPTIPQTQSSIDLSKRATSSAPAVNSSFASSKNDLGTMNDQAKAAIDAGVSNAMTNKGLTPDKNVVEDTPEFQDFMNQLNGNEKFNYQQYADAFRTQSGMSDWIKMRESSREAINTATQYYGELIKEMKANPDLPRAIQNQRVQMYIDTRDSIIQNAKSQMETAVTAISDINTALNSQLGIVQAQRSEDDRKRQTNLDIFKTLLENGTPFTDNEKAQWAAALGVPQGTLNSLVAKSKNTDKFESVNGKIYQFRPNASGQLELYKTYGTSASSGTGTGTGTGTGATGDTFIDSIRNSSQFKNSLTVTERTALAKNFSTIDQLQNVVNELGKVNTDPIIGFFKSLNPYDLDARKVNSQLAAMVPNVARGLYGEVGVLTDNDIKNYIQTLPNIKSTEDQNKFVAALTAQNALSAIRNSLNVSANSKLDVSRFEQTYVDKQNQINSLLNSIGNQGGGSSYSAGLDALSGGTTSQSSSGGLLSGVWNAISGMFK